MHSKLGQLISTRQRWHSSSNVIKSRIYRRATKCRRYSEHRANLMHIQHMSDQQFIKLFLTGTLWHWCNLDSFPTHIHDRWCGALSYFCLTLLACCSWEVFCAANDCSVTCNWCLFCWQMMQHLSPFKVAWEAENRSCIFDMLLMMQKPTDFSCSFRVFNKNTTVAFWLHSHIWNVYTVCERLSKAIKQNKSGQQKLRLPISPLPSPSAVDFPYQRDNQTKQIKTWIILRKNTIWLLKAINFFKFLYQIWGCWMTSYHL